MNDNTDPIAAPVLKVISVWAAVGITSWSDFAAFIASMYTLCLIGEFFWKKVAKPIAQERGWISKRDYVGGDDAAE